MAPRATRAGAPLADRQPHHHSPSSASRVPQIRKRPRGSGSARRARTRRARAPEVVAGGVSARPDARPRRHRPGTIQDEPGNARDGRGYANAKKAILAPRVFVKRAKRRNGNAGRTSQPARRAWPCTRGRCETCRRGPRGRSSGSSCRTPRVAFATRVVHGRSDLSQSLARNSLEAGISPSCACQPSLFRRIVWANSLKRRRTGADSEWHRLPSPGEIEPTGACRAPSLHHQRFQTAGPVTPSDRRVCARPRVASAPSEPNPNPSREHGGRRAALHGHDRLEGGRSRQARGASSIRIRPISSLDEDILIFQQRRVDDVPSPPPPR